jgi:dynein heavy chain
MQTGAEKSYRAHSLRLPNIKTGTPKRGVPTSIRNPLGSTPRSYKQRQRNESADLAEEIAKNRLGSEGQFVPTLGIFKTSFLKEKPSIQETLKPPKHSRSLVLENSQNLSLSKPMSPVRKKTPRSNPRYLGTSDKYLPLDHFAPKDEMSPRSLIAKGAENGEVCYAKTLYRLINGEVTWEPVIVHSFDKASKRYHVQLLNHDIHKYVRRMNLIFDFENQEEFFKNREIAEKFRLEARKGITEEIFIATRMPEMYTPREVDYNTLVRIISRTGISLDKLNSESVEDYIIQIHANHDYAILKGILHHFWNESNIQNAMRGLDISPPTKPVPPETGCVISFPDFELLKVKVFNISLISHPIFIQCLDEVNKKFFEVLDWRSLFEFPSSSTEINIKSELPINIDDFYAIQQHVQKNFKLAAHRYWISQTAEILRKRLGNVLQLDAPNTSWRELHLDIRRFFKLVRYKMSGLASDCLEKGMRGFENFLFKFASRESALDVGERVDVAHKESLVRVMVSITNKEGVKSILAEPSPQRTSQVLWSIILSMQETIRNIQPVEFRLFTHIVDPEETILIPPDIEEHFFLKRLASNIQNVIRLTLQDASDLIDSMRRFEKILNISHKEFKSELLAAKEQKQLALTTVDNKFSYYVEYYSDLEKEKFILIRDFRGSYDFGLMSVEFQETKSYLLTKIESILETIYTTLIEDLENDIKFLIAFFEHMKNIVEQTCGTIDKVAEVRDYIVNSDQHLKNLSEQILLVKTKHDKLSDLYFPMSEELMNSYCSLFMWPSFLRKFFGSRSHELQQANEVLMKEMEKDKEVLIQEVAEFSNEFVGFKTMGLSSESIESNDFDKIAAAAAELKKKLMEAKEKTDIINRRENILGQEKSEYNELNTLLEDSKPYFDLWELATDLRSSLPIWMESSINQLDVNNMYNNVGNWFKTLGRLEERFAREKEQLYVVRLLNNDLENFKEYLPLVTALSTSGLRDRHWNELRDKLKIYITPDLNISLSMLIEQGLHKGEKLLVLTEIAERANKEMTIEKTLDSLDHDWARRKVDLISYKRTWLLTSAEETQMQVDDCVMKVQNLLSSPFVLPFKDRISHWERQLKTLAELLNEWMRMQKYWVYLEPIFSSSDIAQYMATESKIFNGMDFDYRRMVQLIADNKTILACAHNDMFLKFFASSNEDCERLLKSLHEYLYAKRNFFPRFYFLSDDEMLDIFSHTSNPHVVQKHMQKFFHGIGGLKLNENNKIIGIVSHEGEEIILAHKVRPNIPLHQWLKDLEDSMVTTIRIKIFEAAMMENPSIKELPLQVTQVALYIQWTQIITEILNGRGYKALFNEPEVSEEEKEEEGEKEDAGKLESEKEEMIKVEGSEGNQENNEEEMFESEISSEEEPVPLMTQPELFAEFKKRLEFELEEIVNWLRVSIPRLERINLGSLAIMYVYQRDMINSIKECREENDFEWSIQIRHYIDDNEVRVKTLYVSQEYGYEYLGNQLSIVRTPLTEKCQRALFLAHHLKFAGSPEGPAGTGKSETIKDLARLVGRHCLVFNCSEGLDSNALASFFKGLLMTGAWSCFDEFNRLESEVLSLVSQQILTILLALRTRDEKVNFEGDSLVISKHFGAFATMNPIYREKTFLPDSLKNLLRPVTMISPDIYHICQISLYSYGFKSADSLAQKLVTLFKLCGEQLSGQDHYDFGLRTMKTTLNAASFFRARAASPKPPPMTFIQKFSESHISKTVLQRSFTLQMKSEIEELEESIIVKALISCNKPKLVGQDVTIFHNLLNDLFPGTSPKEFYREDLKTAIINVMEKCGYSAHEEFLTKVYEIYELTQIRHSVMLVGPTMSGKTTALRIVCDALNALKTYEITNKLANRSIKAVEHYIRENYKALIKAFKELQLDIDNLEEKFLKDNMPHIKLEELREISKECENIGVVMHSLNPKAHDVQRLFGKFSEDNSDWEDGLASSLIRKFALDNTRREKWMMFDGPVESSWVENLNTALDDNRMLCLNSGETIKITDQMHIFFEVDSLESASLATISRCGMVYFDPILINPSRIFRRYTKAKMPFALRDYSSKLEQFFDWIVLPSLEIVKQCELLFPVSENWLVSSFIKLLDSLLLSFKSQPFFNEMDQNPSEEEGSGSRGGPGAHFSLYSATALLQLESHFFFAVVWTFGSVLARQEDREAFDQFLRDRNGLVDTSDDIPSIQSIRKALGTQRLPTPFKGYFKLSKDVIPRPHFTLPLRRKIKVFDMIYSKDKKSWISWEESPIEHLSTRGAKDDKVTTAPEFIIVPTMDIIKYSFFLERFSEGRHSVLLIGPTGTSKSILLKQFMRRKLHSNDVFPLLVHVTANTRPDQLQKRVESKLERQRKGVLVPSLGRSLLVITEDINMAGQDAHGSQPPLELIRQWFDYKGWYDLQYSDYRQLENVYFFAAMTPQVGSARNISLRILRHFACMNLSPPSDKTLQDIFEVIFEEICSSYNERASRGMEERVVKATLELYRKVQETFKPTPKHIHYSYNIRDVSQLFKGMAICYPKAVRRKEILIRLWYHEALRTFADRLVDVNDHVMFLKIIDEIAVSHFKSLADTVVVKEDEIRIMNSDLLDEVPSLHTPIDMLEERELPLFGVDIASDAKDYVEIKDIDSIAKAMTKYLERYNSLNVPLLLPVFKYVAEHMLRVLRIIKSPQSHGLLVGEGGAGKYALAKLAAFIYNQEIFSIEIKHKYSIEDWRNDFRRVLIATGVEGNKGVFIIEEMQIVHEAILEDLNNFLNSGEVPLLFTIDEINHMLSKQDLYVSESEKVKNWHKFLRNCRENLTVIICMSAVGTKFRSRVRLFPALVNCTTINWLLDWPRKGLLSVATDYFKKVNEIPRNLQSGVAHVCVQIFEDIKERAYNLKRKEGRYIYITPINYVDLLRTFVTILKTKKANLEGVRSRYENSLNIIKRTNKSVGVLEKELKEKEGALETQNEELQTLLQHIEEQSTFLREKQAVVEVEERKLSIEMAEADKIRQECEVVLNQVLPQLQAAKEALYTVSKNDISELKTLKKPPLTVKMILEAVCIILKVPPVRYKKGGNFIEDYWLASMGKKVLGNPKIMEKLASYDQKPLSRPILEQLQTLVNTSEFTPEVAEHASVAAKGMCMYVIALVHYNNVLKDIRPKEKMLEQARQRCSVLSTELDHKKTELSQIQSQLTFYINEKINKDRDRENLKKAIKLHSTRISRAEKLIGGLGGETKRWGTTVRLLVSGIVNLIGDVILGAAFIVFLGAFPANYRDACIEKWQNLVTIQGVNSSESFNFVGMFGDAVTVREWLEHELPSDDFSKENAIILHNSLRYSICLDPQSQAYRWLRHLHKGIVCTRFNDPRFLHHIETVFQYGQPIIIRIEDSVDSVMLPLLKKEFRQNGRMIKFGDIDMRFTEGFNLYMTTQLNNPHFNSEITSLVTTLNFALTPDGLYDQILSLIVSFERKELEEKHNALIHQSTNNKKELRFLENEIVEQLSSVKGDILDDEHLVHHLSALRDTAEDIQQRLKTSETTERRINKARESYSPVASRATSLFFSVVDIAKIQPIYQFSLKWFLWHCSSVLKCPSDITDEQKRVEFLMDGLTKHLFEKVCFSLFEVDKLLFAVLLSIRIILTEEKVTRDLISFIIKDTFHELDEEIPFNWLNERSWILIKELTTCYPFKDPPLNQYITSHEAAFKRVYVESLKPESEAIPGPYSAYFPTDQRTIEMKAREEGDVSSLFQYTKHRYEAKKAMEAALSDRIKNIFTILQKICLLRCFRPDRLLKAYETLVTTVLDKRFTNFYPADLEECYEESRPRNALLVLHNQTSDPVTEIFHLNTRMKLHAKINIVALRTGKLKQAKEIVKLSQTKGMWVILQNIHLCPSFLPYLEEKLEELSNREGAHTDFRLWLTSSPTAHLPISILQNCIKITLEPPGGLKSNLIRAWKSVEHQFVNAKTILQKKLLFGMCYLHSAVQERRKYRGFGWNLPYDFTESDFLASTQEIMDLVQEPPVPWRLLKYCIAELTYGGRVSELQDLKLLQTLSSPIITDKIMTHDYSISENGGVLIPDKLDNFKVAMSGIEEYEIIESPELYGLHPNQALHFEKNEGNRILALISHVQRSALLIGDVDYRKTYNVDEDVLLSEEQGKLLYELSSGILKKLPPSFDLQTVYSKYPITYDQSLNIVLHQETLRYNFLLERVRSTLLALEKSSKGDRVLSLDLEAEGNQLLLGKVPAVWMQVSFVTVKPLAGFITNLIQRVSFIQNWIDNGQPKIFWLPGFFYPQAFLTSVLQNHARKYKVGMELLHFDHEVLKKKPNDYPEFGCYVDGLIIEGAQYNEGMIEEITAKDFLCYMPTVHFIPTTESTIKPHVYHCPLYKTAARGAGPKSSKNSNNFIGNVKLKSEVPGDHWIRRGVALICEHDSEIVFS